LLVPVGDEQALAEAIGEVLEDPALRRRLLKAGKTRSRDFSMERVGEAYERLFMELRR